LVNRAPDGAQHRHGFPFSSAVSDAMNGTVVRSIVLGNRPRVLTAGVVLMLLVAIAQWATVSVRPAESAQRATLRERLIFGLLAKIPSEIEFIDLVVLKVHEGKLPERLVNQTFFWARERAAPSENGSPQRPIIYFKPAMTARAKRIGVAL